MAQVPPKATHSIPSVSSIPSACQSRFDYLFMQVFQSCQLNATVMTLLTFHKETPPPTPPAPSTSSLILPLTLTKSFPSRFNPHFSLSTRGASSAENPIPHVRSSGEACIPLDHASRSPLSFCSVATAAMGGRVLEMLCFRKWRTGRERKEEDKPLPTPSPPSSAATLSDPSPSRRDSSSHPGPEQVP